MSLFFGAQLPYISLTFILIYPIKAVKLREIVRSASYLTTQPRPLSPLHWSDFSIFWLSPGYSSIFFQLTPSTVPFHWHLSASPLPTLQYLSAGWEFLSVFQPSLTQCLVSEYALGISLSPLPQYLYVK